jgi:6-pyruvoyltetrahydropterin/6-carboxytetrahydropterin synthase
MAGRVDGMNTSSSREVIPQQRGEFRVSVSNDSLVFASAHFITFAGHRCEGLHGHNYRARVTVAGTIGAEGLVFDFLQLKAIMQRLCGQLDHLVLLPLRSTRITITEDNETVKVAVDGQPRYLFPRQDCALLPIPNTTVEMLAELLAGRLRGELAAVGDRDLTTIEVEVEENVGQAATYRLQLRSEK